MNEKDPSESMGTGNHALSGDTVASQGGARPSKNETRMGGVALPRAERNKFCCLCGEPRKPTQKPLESFGNNVPIVTIGKHRELKPGRWEQSPQLLVSVNMWRNGGTAPGETHICDGCVIVGLRIAKEFVDSSLAALEK